MRGIGAFKYKALMVLIVILVVSGCTPTEETRELSPATKESLDALVKDNDYVTGYDMNSYKHPVMIIDYSIIEKTIKTKDIDKISQMQDDLDRIGEQVASLGYDTILFCSKSGEELKKIAIYEYGAIFFNEAAAPAGLRVRYGDLVLQYTQVDKSGYYPSIIGIVYNAGTVDYTNVYI